jgi:hypothetical protein
MGREWIKTQTGIKGLEPSPPYKLPPKRHMTKHNRHKRA